MPSRSSIFSFAFAFIVGVLGEHAMGRSGDDDMHDNVDTNHGGGSDALICRCRNPRNNDKTTTEPRKEEDIGEGEVLMERENNVMLWLHCS